MTLLSTAEARDLATEFVNATPAVSLVLDRDGTPQTAQSVVYAYAKRQAKDRAEFAARRGETTAKETDVDVTFYRLDAFNVDVGDRFAWLDGTSGFVRRTGTDPALTMLCFAEASFDIGSV